VSERTNQRYCLVAGSWVLDEAEDRDTRRRRTFIAVLVVDPFEQIPGRWPVEFDTVAGRSITLGHVLAPRLTARGSHREDAASPLMARDPDPPVGLQLSPAGWMAPVAPGAIRSDRSEHEYRSRRCR
jgi:hypothetical protein